MTKKRLDGPGSGDDFAPAIPVELSTLTTRVSADLLRLVRQRAAVAAMTLDEFIQEAIEEHLQSSS